MEAASFSETFVFIYQTTWYCIPEDCNSELNCTHHIKLLQNYWFLFIGVQGNVRLITQYKRGTTHFPKIQKHPAHLRCQKCIMKHVSYWGLTVLEWPVNHTFIWFFLLVACEPIHIFAWEKETANSFMLKIQAITLQWYLGFFAHLGWTTCGIVRSTCRVLICNTSN